MTKVFVYGTLLRGCGNHDLLKGQDFLGAAKTNPEFIFVHVGGFPGLVEGGETIILGEVYEVDDDCLRRLDSLEGCNPNNPDRGMYGRLLITLEDGQEVTTYRYNVGGPSWSSQRSVEDYEEIKSGDWQKFDSGRQRNYYS